MGPVSYTHLDVYKRQETFGTFEALKKADFESLVAIRDVGDVVAQCILDFFASPQVEATLEKLSARGVKPQPCLLYTSDKSIFF